MLPAVFDFLNGPVRDLVTQIYDAVGYLGVAIWVAIESIIIPIPSELVLPFAGFLVGTGGAMEPLTGQPWSYWLVVLAGTLGATAGALIAYGIGLWGGRPIVERWGRYLGISHEDLDRAEAFFMRYGDFAAFFGRLVPVKILRHARNEGFGPSLDRLLREAVRLSHHPESDVAVLVEALQSALAEANPTIAIVRGAIARAPSR